MLEDIIIPFGAIILAELGDGGLRGAVQLGLLDDNGLAGAEAELKKIPFFVRGKARRNTERYALDKGIAEITVETLYDAKAFYGR